MATQPALSGTVLPTDARSVAKTLPAQRWLKAARLTWLALAALIVGMLILAAPRDLELLRTLCTGRICYTGQVHVSNVARLTAHGISVPTYGAWLFSLQLVCALMHLGVATLIFWRRPDDWMALLGAATLLVWGANASEIIFILEDVSPLWWWTVHLVGSLGIGLLTYFFLIFPDGRFVPRWSMWLAPVWIVADIVYRLAAPYINGTPNFWRVVGLMYDGWMVSLVIAQVYRYRRAATTIQRRQMRWVLLGVVVGIGGFASLDALRLMATLSIAGFKPFPLFISYLTYYSAMLLVPLAFGIAILRAQLYEINGIINRTLVYGALTGCVIGMYVLVVGYLGTLFQAKGSLAISLVATGLVAIVFQPLRNRLQRGVNRLMYGDRDEPYTIISRLGQRLETTLAPDAVLPTIAHTVREALKLPYVAIAIDQDGQCATAASSGALVPDTLVLPLTYQSETMGQLILGPRRPGETWTVADRRLLADLARQTGTAIHAVRLTLDLQHARARLVAAREEERRRLRRDLHDGLGPVLAALALQADTARDLVRDQPDEAELILDDLTTQAQAAVVDIRRLVYALRPPALDDLGLVAALRSYANSVTRGGVTVVIDAPDPFPTLLAAAEVAAYRIVQEAVTNVVRHAHARSCAIEISVDEHMHIVVTDDGCGIPDEIQAGVGLTSMRERARELGGDCEVGRRPDGGTVVHAWLPLS